MDAKSSNLGNILDRMRKGKEETVEKWSEHIKHWMNPTKAYLDHQNIGLLER